MTNGHLANSGLTTCCCIGCLDPVISISQINWSSNISYDRSTRIYSWIFPIPCKVEIITGTIINDTVFGHYSTAYSISKGFGHYSPFHPITYGSIFSRVKKGPVETVGPTINNGIAQHCIVGFRYSFV